MYAIFLLFLVAFCHDTASERTCSAFGKAGDSSAVPVPDVFHSTVKDAFHFSLINRQTSRTAI